VERNLYLTTTTFFRLSQPSGRQADKTITFNFVIFFIKPDDGLFLKAEFFNLLAQK